MTSSQIVNGTITGLDIKTNAVGGVDVKTGAIASIDLANASVANADLADGAVDSAAIEDGTVASGHLATGTVSPRIFARVNTDGTTAASASVVLAQRMTIGQYAFTISADLSACAVTVTRVTALRVATLGGTGPGDVNVAVTDAVSNDPADAAFNLIAVC